MGEERVFAGVPAQEVRGAGVRAVIFAAGPNLVEQVGAGMIDRSVKVVL